MTDFKEKLRQDAAIILENKEELNEADLKEWLFWNSQDSQEKEAAAQIRYGKVAELEQYLESLLLTVKSLKNKSEYYKPKKFKDDVVTNFARDVNNLKIKVTDFTNSLTAALSAFDNQCRKYLPNDVDFGGTKRR